MGQCSKEASHSETDVTDVTDVTDSTGEAIASRRESCSLHQHPQAYWTARVMGVRVMGARVMSARGRSVFNGLETSRRGFTYQPHPPFVGASAWCSSGTSEPRLELEVVVEAEVEEADVTASWLEEEEDETACE